MNVFVFGNLGSGKSTLIEGIKKVRPDIIVAEEHFSENPFLELFNKDPKKWGLLLQLRFLTDYIDSYHHAAKKSSDKRTIIIDAGVWANWYVFTRNLRTKELITHEEYGLYEKIAQTLTTTAQYPEPGRIIYLDTPPEVCLERIKARGWNFQKEISLSYLQDLDHHLKDMVENYRKKGIIVVEKVEAVETICRELSI